MVIPVRMFKNKTYFGEPIQFGTIAAVTTPAAESKSGKPAAPAQKSKRPAKPAAVKQSV
jgi:hypothetical protein